jgi:hypothetical protein
VGDPAAAVDLSERTVAENRPVRGKRLPENLLAVSDEQEQQVTVAVDELSIIERCHYSLPGPGRRDHQVSVTIVALALNRERLQHSLLVWVRSHVKMRE